MNELFLEQVFSVAWHFTARFQKIYGLGKVKH
jgi:hypothetical protein